MKFMGKPLLLWRCKRLELRVRESENGQHFPKTSSDKSFNWLLLML